MLRVKMTKQHDVTTRRITTFCLIVLIEKKWCCALTRQNNVMLQHDVMTTFCLNVFINQTSTSSIPSQQIQPPKQSNPTILTTIGSKSPPKVEKYSL